MDLALLARRTQVDIRQHRSILLAPPLAKYKDHHGQEFLLAQMVDQVDPDVFVLFVDGAHVLSPLDNVTCGGAVGSAAAATAASGRQGRWVFGLCEGLVGVFPSTR